MAMKSISPKTLAENKIDRKGATPPIAPGWLDLEGLKIYSSCSIRWLREHCNKKENPIPHSRVDNGKILVKVSKFDAWMDSFSVTPTNNTEQIVNEMITELLQKCAVK